MYKTKNRGFHLIVASALLLGAFGIAGSTPTGATGAFSGRAGSGQPDAITCPGNPAQCFADVASDNPFFENANRLYMQEVISGYACGGAGEPCDAANRPYYRPGNTVTRQQMTKFVDNARRMPGIAINVPTTNTDPIPISVITTGQIAIRAKSEARDGVRSESESATGVAGSSSSGDGVFGGSVTGTGVKALSGSFGVVGESLGGAFVAGVHGTSTNAFGVWGFSANSHGVYGSSTNGSAGYFQGNVTINGSCTGCFGPSRVDHPLDPENQYLFHSPVQSDDYTNIYNGNVILDGQGVAWVEMPEWFSAINSDFRYQLTGIGAPAPNLYIAQEIENNRFKIAGGASAMKVSWQVTATRSDAFAEQYRVPVEQAKPAGEQGLYLNPELYGQPETRGLGYELNGAAQEQLDGAKGR